MLTCTAAGLPVTQELASPRGWAVTATCGSTGLCGPGGPRQESHVPSVALSSGKCSASPFPVQLDGAVRALRAGRGGWSKVTCASASPGLDLSCSPVCRHPPHAGWAHNSAVTWVTSEAA